MILFQGDTMWFVKSRRAQSVDDYETWIQGGVVPTLNAFDNGTETRATVLIFYGNRVDDIRIQGDVINTLQARMGTGGGNMPMVAFSVREDAKANNFSATETEIALTLQGHQPSPQSHHAQIFIAVQEPVAFDTYNQTLNQNTTQALRSAASDVDHIGAVVMPTLTAANNPSRSPQSTEVTAQVEVVNRVTSTVRRLTPTECERLQGFPDGWTGERFDEKKQAVIAQADSNRYKQMGNAVAVSVVDWIIKRLVANT